MDAIFARRSIRKYTQQPVPEKMITTLLKAAMSAPSAGNEQPWHFIVINERQLLDDITGCHPYSQMLRQAQTAILVCADERLCKYPENYWIQDCSAATQNILIAATHLGLGTVWLGIYPIEERVAGLRKILGIPQEVTPFSLVAIGYPAQQLPPVDRFNLTRIHSNKW